MWGHIFWKPHLYIMSTLDPREELCVALCFKDNKMWCDKNVNRECPHINVVKFCFTEIEKIPHKGQTDFLNNVQVHHFQDNTGSRPTCSWPRMMTPWGLIVCQDARFSLPPRSTPSWYADHTPSRVIQVMQKWCHVPTFRLMGSWATFTTKQVMLREKPLSCSV